MIYEDVLILQSLVRYQTFAGELSINSRTLGSVILSLGRNFQIDLESFEANVPQMLNY